MAQCAFKPIGHRGGSSYYHPENTLVSLEQGFLEDIFAAEIDIRYTSDSVLVLMHDSYIDRTTNGIGEVKELTSSYLKTLDAGSWKNPQYKGTKVPTLVEALTLANKYHKKLYLNMKVFVPKLIAKALKEANVPSDIVMLDPDDLDKVATYHKILPNTPLVYFGELPASADDASFYQFLKDNGVIAIEIPADYIRQATDDYFVSLRGNTHANNMELWAYTVNDPAYFRILKDFGIDALETDRPTAAREVFCQNGAGGYFPEKRITGQWDFDKNLKGIIGSQLNVIGDTTVVGQKIQFGTTESFKLPKIENTNVNIALIPAFDAAHALRFFSNIAPETLPGVLDCDNTYSLVFDLLKPKGQNAYTAILQTSNNNSDDADLFLEGATNGFGVLEQYKGSFEDSTWIRLAFVFDLYQEKLDEYLNGDFVGTVTLKNSQNGRFCINNNWGVQSSNFFSDNDGETNPMFVSCIQLRNYAMSADEIKALGAPKAAKINPSILLGSDTDCPQFSQDVHLTQDGNPLTLHGDAGDQVNYRWEMNNGSGWQMVAGTSFMSAKSNTLNIGISPESIDGYRFRLIAFNDCQSISNEINFNYTGISSRLSNAEQELFSIYPNPSGGKVNLDMVNLSQNYDLTVYSVVGIQVLKKKSIMGNCQFDLSEGSYVVKVKTDRKTACKKLIVTK
ncbi:MAG TPA: glycerophosphodiester phosphodiesterase family protein [Prolixibacteraceae bacterium]|nr:glycerophosphodiester phosphodiesterase family protein [Prolixibacteraceae bacterium]